MGGDAMAACGSLVSQHVQIGSHLPAHLATRNVQVGDGDHFLPLAARAACASRSWLPSEQRPNVLPSSHSPLPSTSPSSLRSSGERALTSVAAVPSGRRLAVSSSSGLPHLLPPSVAARSNDLENRVFNPTAKLLTFSRDGRYCRQWRGHSSWKRMAVVSTRGIVRGQFYTGDMVLHCKYVDVNHPITCSSSSTEDEERRGDTSSPAQEELINGSDVRVGVGGGRGREVGGGGRGGGGGGGGGGLAKELQKAANKTATTFAPRASAPSKNPAVKGSILYTVFEVQGWLCILLGGALSFNLLFPSDHPDIWRLMGMWSVWMFTIPSWRARDCSKQEKAALNSLFLLIPVINVAIPLFWTSFPAVFSADVVALFLVYAWQFKWFQTN